MARLSFRQQALPLDRAEVHALGRHNGVAPGGFDEQPAAVLEGLRRRLDDALRGFAGGAFLRLGSRSPKDTASFLRTGGLAQTGAGALALLGDGSQRLAFDLRRCLQRGWLPTLFLREWHDIAPGDEWRGFVVDGRVVGLCPAWPGTQVDACAQSLHGPARALTRLGEDVGRAFGGDRVVFDAWLRTPAQAALIELNPWGPPTRAMHFDWQVAWDDTLRADTVSGPRRWPLHALQAGTAAD